MSERSWGFRTRAVHAGAVPDATTGARATPIYQTSSFVFEDTTDAASLFALQKYGLIYSRIANPTVAVFEERLASLEGGLGAVATSSGQAAEFLTFACLAGAGDHIVATAGLYGGTITQLDVTLRRFGVDTAFVYTFASRHLPTSDDPERDFDLGSFGIVKVLPSGRTGTAYPGMPWEPKAAFHRLAEYGRARAGASAV